MSGLIGDLSPQQEDALGKLRGALCDVEKVASKDDHYFLRWLRAQKFNVAQAEEMLRKHIDVRKKHKLDTILSDHKPVEVLEKYLPGGLMGEDREGHPVWYDNFNYDFRGLHYSVRLDDIMTYFMYQAELCLQHCAEATIQKGRQIESITFVMDFEDLSIQKHLYWPGIQMIRKLLSMFEANYPECTNRVFLIHLPSFFRRGYDLVKSFMDENTRSKLMFLGSDYKEVLLKYISPDQLPEAYGGTICDPDPYCTKYINPGGDVPKKYYLSNLMKSSKKEMERVVVGRRSSYLISYNVDTPGSKLRWDFMTTDHGIKYGWYLKSSTGQRNIDVVPVKKAKSHVIPENGMHICESPGEYVLKFDNSHGWIRSKEVFYLVTVIPPESDATPLETKATPTQSEDSVVSTSAAPIIRDGHT
jgi:hypothetical protein